MLILILKWIGLIISILIGFLLLLLSYFVFLPISLKLRLDFDKKKYVAFVSDPLRLFFFRVYLSEKKIKTELSFIFRMIKANPKNKKENKNEETKKDDNKPKEKKSLKNRALKIKTIINRKNNKDAIKYVFEQTIKTIKKFKFKALFLGIEFSGGSPDTTGYITAAISILPFLYGNKNSIYPDFHSDNAYINGRVKMSCYFKLLWFIILMFKLISNRKVSRFVREVRHL